MKQEKLLHSFSDKVYDSCQIDPSLFDKYQVKRGLRNKDHSGVLVGLTKIGEVVGYEKEGDKITPVDGQLYYRGIEIKKLIKGFQQESRHGFDETVYLLLSGCLPGREESECFSSYLARQRDLPEQFTSRIISLKGLNVMNMLARSVLVMYNFDEKAEDTDHQNHVRQALDLITRFPVITAYAYHTVRHAHQRRTLSIRPPQSNMSTAENFLYMLKGKGKYSRLETDLIDMAMILHAEHGGGNNSTFTIRVTSSTGTDIYSAVSGAMASLKGPLHGGAVLKILEMMTDIKKNVKQWDNEKEVEAYLLKILQKKAFDRSGKIYGIGHAIYTLSDPRAVVLKEKARELAIEKGRHDEFVLYDTVERLAPQVFLDFKGGKSDKVVSANVDFYSGFVYHLIGIRKELYTPLFAMARIAGWCAHRLEELNFASKRIIRPAYKNIGGRKHDD